MGIFAILCACVCVCSPLWRWCSAFANTRRSTTRSSRCSSVFYQRQYLSSHNTKCRPRKRKKLRGQLRSQSNRRQTCWFLISSNCTLFCHCFDCYLLYVWCIRYSSLHICRCCIVFLKYIYICALQQTQISLFMLQARPASVYVYKIKKKSITLITKMSLF